MQGVGKYSIKRDGTAYYDIELKITHSEQHKVEWLHGKSYHLNVNHDEIEQNLNSILVKNHMQAYSVLIRELNWGGGAYDPDLMQEVCAIAFAKAREQLG